MKVLILTTDYPNLEGDIPAFFIHVRSMFYKENGIELDVLSFNAKSDYIIDGINVITLATYKKIEKYYDVLILHAPNLRNHYMFLKKFGKRFEKHLYFFHGHEILKINKDYPKPYKYMRKKLNILQDIYDFIKLKIWHYYFIRNNRKSYYIFVSNWMKEMFLKNLKINEKIITKNAFITYNSIGEKFETNNYDKKQKKIYDFITIRSNLDESKYSIDIVNKLAYKNSDKKFLLIGKGKFFDFFDKAPNITLIEKNCNHKEIISFLNKSKCALMPTRTDSQGLMACEMATFGIPLITSNIEICYEIFSEFENVDYINNDEIETEDIVDKYNSISVHETKKNEKYFSKNTCQNEIKILEKILDK